VCSSFHLSHAILILCFLYPPPKKGAYDRAVERYLEAARKLVADPALRAGCGSKALAKAATFSNATVQQRMVDNYHEAFAAQVSLSVCVALVVLVLFLVFLLT